MLSPYKDVDFLFEDVIGNTYDATDTDKGKIIIDKKTLKNKDYPIIILKRDEVVVTFDGANETPTGDNVVVIFKM